ncbi:MAG: VOC family protein [Hyphomonadaceae bacterium]|nr:VOC family protein [Hyphomonadaceae bacterium]
MAVRSLAYVRIGTRDLAAWRAFGECVLGLQAVDSGDPNLLLLRMDDRPWRFRIQKHDTEAYLGAGLECPDQAAYDATVARLRAAGVELQPGSADEAKARCVRSFVSCNDPSGNSLEIFCGHTVAGTPFVSPVGALNFVTDEGGMGHIVVPALKLAATRAFYVDLLGFGDSDEMRIQMGDHSMGMHFLHATGPRHHTVALAEFPTPSGAVHVMIEAKTLDDVGYAYDRALKAGCHISATMGKHTNDHMVGFYARSPSGFDVEFGYGGLQPDWNTYIPTITQKESLWGHKWDFSA